MADPLNDLSDLGQQNWDDQQRLDKAHEQESRSARRRGYPLRMGLPLGVELELRNLTGADKFPLGALSYTVKFFPDGFGWSYYVYDTAGQHIGGAWTRGGKVDAERDAALFLCKRLVRL